jgi:hypothetical protein
MYLIRMSCLNRNIFVLKFRYSYNFRTIFLTVWYRLGFPLSRDFSDFQVPGLLDFFSPGTTGPSGSLGPVPSSPGTFPGLPGTSRDQITLCFCTFLHFFRFFCCCNFIDIFLHHTLLCEVPIETIGKSFVIFVYHKLLYRLWEKELNGKLHQTIMNHPIMSIENAL